MIFLYSLKNISWPTSIQVRLVNKVVCFCFSSFEGEASLFFVNIEHDENDFKHVMIIMVISHYNNDNYDADAESSDKL